MDMVTRLTRMATATLRTRMATATPRTVTATDVFMALGFMAGIALPAELRSIALGGAEPEGGMGAGCQQKLMSRALLRTWCDATNVT
jgi:hypothetical protein